jgi:hypothetical protein
MEGMKRLAAVVLIAALAVLTLALSSAGGRAEEQPPAGQGRAVACPEPAPTVLTSVASWGIIGWPTVTVYADGRATFHIDGGRCFSLPGPLLGELKEALRLAGFPGLGRRVFVRPSGPSEETVGYDVTFEGVTVTMEDRPDLPPELGRVEQAADEVLKVALEIYPPPG